MVVADRTERAPGSVNPARAAAMSARETRDAHAPGEHPRPRPHGVRPRPGTSTTRHLSESRFPMPDTTTPDSARTHAASEPPTGLTGLTGAAASVYTELVNLTDDEGATAAELALAAGLGRSTTGKALVTLEDNGLAVRTRGGHDGPRRTPDRWRAAPTPKTSRSDGPGTPEPTNGEPEPSPADTPEPDTSHTHSQSSTVGETAPDNAQTSDSTETSGTAAASAADVPQDPPPQDEKHTVEDAADGADMHGDSAGNSPEPEGAPAPQARPEQLTAAPAKMAVPAGEKKRLAPGGLRQMVIDHLSAHPGEVFTATKISRVIEKSSGAIANALDKLVKQGIAEQASDRPRTYRLATSDSNV